MLETIMMLTPLLMYLSYEAGKYVGQRAIKQSKERYISFFGDRLIEVDK